MAGNAEESQQVKASRIKTARDGSPDAVYHRGRWDRLSFDEQVNLKPDNVDRIEQAGEGKNVNLTPFVGETFSRMFGYNDLEKIEDVQPEHKWMERLHDEAEGLKEYSALREQCKGDPAWSCIASMAFMEDVKDAIPEMPEETGDLPNMRKAAEGLQDYLDYLNAEKAKGQSNQGAIDRVEKDLNAAKQQLESVAAAAQQAAQKMSGAHIRNAIRSAASAAQHEVAEASEAQSAFGFGDEAGMPGSGISSEEKMELAKQLKSNSKLKELMKLAGRMRNIAAKAQEHKVEYARSEVTSIEKGGDIDRVLPSEMAMLCDDATEDQFYSALLDESVSQYRLEGKDRKGKGPIICLVDNSGSMSGQPELWSKAFSFGLYQIASMHKRPFYGIHFDTAVGPTLRAAPGEKFVSAKSVMDWLVHFSCGGTDFRPALNEAVRAIRSEPTYKDADVIVITDDQWSAPADFARKFKSEKDELGFRLYAIAVGVPATALKDLGAITYELADMLQAENLSKEIFSAL